MANIEHRPLLRFVSLPCLVQDFPFENRPISRVGDHLEGVTGGAVGDDC